MSDAQFLSTDPQAGLPKASAPPPPSGTWEDRGIAGKVWHPADGAKEGNRVDNSVLGMPPEMAALSGLAVTRAIGAPAVNLGARAVAGTKAAIGQATPLLKYEATKTTLEHLGVPTPLALAAAIAVSGYRGNGVKKVAGAVEGEAAAIPAAQSAAPPEIAPAAAPPAAAPAPPVAPPPLPDPLPALPKLKLSDLTTDEKQILQEYVDKGLPKKTVLQEIAKMRAAAPPDAPLPPPAESPVPVKPKILAAEGAEFDRLLKSGKTLKEAMELIQQQRDFSQKMGLPSATAARASVVARNATGRWPE